MLPPLPLLLGYKGFEDLLDQEILNLAKVPILMMIMIICGIYHHHKYAYDEDKIKIFSRNRVFSKFMLSMEMISVNNDNVHIFKGCFMLMVMMTILMLTIMMRIIHRR